MTRTTYIFDLGGVLINLNVGRCMRAFESLMGEENMRAVLGMDSHGEGISSSADDSIRDIQAVSVASKQLMADFERGFISADSFVQDILRYCRPSTSTEQVVEAWMSMLADLPTERLAVVGRVRQQGNPVFLLSNGNDLHFDFINKTYQLDRHFDRLFLSHKMHMAKPEENIFREVDRWVEGKTVFVDDIEINRLAAERYVGWQTFAGIDQILFTF